MTRDNFLDLVVSLIHGCYPLLKVEKDADSFSLVLDGSSASMENLYRVAMQDPASLKHHVERWITELVRANEASPIDRADFDEVRERIMPMVLPPAGPAAAAMVRQGVLPGLDVAYAIDCDRSIAYIPPITFERWGIGLETLHETALDNLTARSQEIAAHAAQDESGQTSIVCVQTLDGYDASRILLPNLHERLRPHLGSPFVAAVPNRDILVCFRNGAELVPLMRAQTAEGFRTMPHQISEGLFLVTADGLAPL
ncbi:MAG: DUF1444 family protein [Tepidisphaerales bacterium]